MDYQIIHYTNVRLSDGLTLALWVCIYIHTHTPCVYIGRRFSCRHICGKRNHTHTQAQSMHEYVWHVKWDEGERNRWLERSNSHPSDHESCLTSGRPTRWRACKLPHCAIDPMSHFNMIIQVLPECTRWREGVLSLSDTRQETSLCVELLKEIVAGKKEFIRRSYENCHFQHKNSAVHLQLQRRQHSNSTWNWFHVFSYERLFLLLTRHTIHYPLLSILKVTNKDLVFSLFYWFFIVDEQVHIIWVQILSTIVGHCQRYGYIRDFGQFLNCFHS